MSNLLDAQSSVNQTTESWQQQWTELLDEMKTMSVGDQVMFIMYKLLPEVGDFMQGTLGNNANTQNALSSIIGNMSDIQDQFNMYNTNTGTGVTTSEAEKAYDDYQDIKTTLSENPALSGIDTSLTNQLEGLFKGYDGNYGNIANNWNDAWYESTQSTGSSADDSLMTKYTDDFSQSNATATGESQTIQSAAQYIGSQLQEFFGEEGNITSSENSGVTVMVNNENTN